MNKTALKKNLHTQVRIRPMAKRYMGDSELEPLDDDWLIENVGNDGVRIKNIRTHHGTVLGYDHIHHFTSDPARSAHGIKYGFLTLNVQIHIGGNRLWIEPPLRPGEAI